MVEIYDRHFSRGILSKFCGTKLIAVADRRLWAFQGAIEPPPESRGFRFSISGNPGKVGPAGLSPVYPHGRGSFQEMPDHCMWEKPQSCQPLSLPDLTVTGDPLDSVSDTAGVCIGPPPPPPHGRRDSQEMPCLRSYICGSCVVNLQ
jgi:hypothetical protein